MKYEYSELISALNEGKIKSISFSVVDYPHYQECKIVREVDYLPRGKQFVWIAVQLTKDNYEKVSFFKSFKDDYKLFHMGRKGTFTLKQLWNKIEIKEIVYNL